MEDLELRQQIEALREARGPCVSSDAARKALLTPGVVEDDMRWLVDHEEHGGSKTARGEEQAAGDMAAAEAEVVRRRIAYGTMRNQTLGRAAKLQALEEELRLLQQEAADTPAEKRQAGERLERHAATKARVEQMEALADDQVAYTDTLRMLVTRLKEEKGGGEEQVAAVRAQIGEVDQKVDRQVSANGMLVHAARQARNGTLLQVTLNDSSRRTRQMLGRKRTEVVKRGDGAKERLRSELEASQEASRQQEIEVEAEEDAKVGLRALEQQRVNSRLRSLEEQFRRIQELMGFADMDAVVERIIAQRQAGERMQQLQVEAVARHERLVEEKARVDTVYEEQVGRGAQSAARAHTGPTRAQHVMCTYMAYMDMDMDMDMHMHLCSRPARARVHRARTPTCA